MRYALPLAAIMWSLAMLPSATAAEGDTQGWRALPLVKDGQVDPQWVHVGYGGFVVDQGALRTECDEQGLGLLLFRAEKFGDCQIRVVYKTQDAKCNAGVYVRIDDGILAKINEKHAPARRENGQLTAESLEMFKDASQRELGPWYAVHHGYEVQICDTAQGHQSTGAVYSLAKPGPLPPTPADGWRTMIITLAGNLMKVDLDGRRLTEFDSESKDVPAERQWYQPRREPKRPQAGYLGLQNHDPGDVVWFKEVSVRRLPSNR